MYFKFTKRKNPKTQEMCSYYRLVESYRDLNNCICHRTILNVGFLAELKSEQLHIVQKILTERAAGKTNLLAQADETVSILLETLWARIISENHIDLKRPRAVPKKIKLLNLAVISGKQVRELGKEWLCYQCLNQLDLLTFLKSLGWDDEQIQLTFTQIICRASYPASELQRSKIIKQISAVCEVTGYPITKISKAKLKHNAHAINKEKDSFKTYLSKKANELFNYKDETILYHLANIYVEGNKHKSDYVFYNNGEAKQKGNRLLTVAMVITKDGFLRYLNIFDDEAVETTAVSTIINSHSLTSI
jgi:hypothetical protein